MSSGREQRKEGKERKLKEEGINSRMEQRRERRKGDRKKGGMLIAQLQCNEL
jgi:hypothetical protein